MTYWWDINGCGPVEKRVAVPQKTKIELPYHPIILFLSANGSSVMMFNLCFLTLQQCENNKYLVETILDLDSFPGLYVKGTVIIAATAFGEPGYHEYR